MIKINEIAFIGYPVTDVKRARDFYENVLRLVPAKLVQELDGMPGKCWIEYEVGNVAFAISNAWEPSGRSGPSVAFEVQNLAESVAHLKEARVTFIEENIDMPACSSALIADPTATPFLFTNANTDLRQQAAQARAYREDLLRSGDRSHVPTRRAPTRLLQI
jgi:catechol 2,3-dioxygenase-like lactoylglutathione lyase family enzyme